MFFIRFFRFLLFKAKYLLLSILFICILFSPLLIKKLKSKYKSFDNQLKKNQLVNSQNCKINFIDYVPKNSSIIVGHAYGSPISHNEFISNKLEKFLISNGSKINNLFLTGDVFHIPNKEKWENLYNILEKDIKVFISPGNHDVDNYINRKVFEENVKQITRFPFIFNFDKSIFVISDSTNNGWLLDQKTINKINQISQDSTIYLLRHNIVANEFLPLSNSLYGFKGNIYSIKELQSVFKNKLTIISGDGGAFNYLPRFFCKEYGKLRFIVNGLGGIKGDIILIVWNNNIYKYVLN